MAKDAPPIRAPGAECDLVPASAAIDRIHRKFPNMTADQVSYVLSAVIGRHIDAKTCEERAECVRGNRQVLKRLLEDPGIPQRTQEWYDARTTMITASDFAQALGCAKFGTQRQFFEKKCSVAPPAFDATIPPLRWGIMFEPVACNIYRSMNCGVHVHEFGLLRHPTIPYIGASPDGITDDGIMLEIKCPWRRKITGEVPLQYYYQIQGQLAVCGLDECDYFECEFEVVDTDADVAYHDGPEYERGVFIEDTSVSPPRYVYPHQSLSSLESLSRWADAHVDPDNNTLRVIWWRLLKSATARLHAEPVMFADLAKRLSPIWDKVNLYRADAAAFETDFARPSLQAPPPARTRKKVATVDAVAALMLPTYAFVEVDDPAITE